MTIFNQEINEILKENQETQIKSQIDELKKKINNNNNKKS